MTQLPRLVCALCATFFCAGTLTVQAEDNAAQAAARAELLQDLQQAPATQTNDMTAPIVTSAPEATAPATPPPATPPSAASAPADKASAPSGGDNPEQAAARAVLLQQLASPPADSNPPATPPAADLPPAAGTVATTADDDTARQAKAAREAKDAAMAEADRQKASATPAVTAAPAASKAAAPGQNIIVPAPPISADQAARLQALDAKYTANQISPADYFNQREAILSGQ